MGRIKDMRTRQEGSQLLELLDYDGAIESFNDILEKKPNDTTSLWLLSTCYYYKGQLDEALKILDQMPKLKKLGIPRFENLWYQKAQIFRFQKKYEKAIEALELLLKKRPKYEIAYFLMIDTNIKKGDYNAAINAANDGLKRMKSSKLIMSMLALSYALSEDKNSSRDILNQMDTTKDKLRLRFLQPEMSLGVRGIVCSKLDDKKEGMDFIKKAVLKNPRSYYPYYCLAAALNYAGETQDAILACQSSQQVQPGNRESLELLEELGGSSQPVRTPPIAPSESSNQSAQPNMEPIQEIDQGSSSTAVRVFEVSQKTGYVDLNMLADLLGLTLDNITIVLYQMMDDFDGDVDGSKFRPIRNITLANIQNLIQKLKEKYA